MKRVLLMAPALALGLFSPAVEAATFSLQEATITDVHAAFSAGALTSTELTQLYLNRIAAYDQAGPTINSVAVLNPDALAEAARLDHLWDQGNILGPLHGIPVLVKDSYDVESLPTSNGVEVFKSLIANEDAFSVAKLRDAGAIILGKANMSTWAFSYDGVSESYGAVINPYATDRTPGGSSSGSGAAVASDFAMLALGEACWGIS